MPVSADDVINFLRDFAYCGYVEMREVEDRLALFFALRQAPSQRAPVIDPRVLRLGVSKLRDIDLAWLRDFSKSGEIAVIQMGDEPLSVMVPFEMYQQMQRELTQDGGR